jgi:hypothetical protein
MEWRKDTAKHSNGEVLFLGPWVVGGIQYDSLCSRGDKMKYVAMCKLPGVTERSHFSTAQEAKKNVEAAVKHWMSKLPQQ